MDVASVLRAVHRDKLFLAVEESGHALPAWADWLIWLGTWMRSQTLADGRRVAVVRLPTRRLSAAFVGLGAMLAASRVHDDTLDWDALQTLPAGTRVHWRVNSGGRAVAYSGLLGSTRDYAGSLCLAISVDTPKRASGATTLLPRASALSYGVTMGNVTPRLDERLTAAASLMRVVVDQASLSWVHSVTADSTVVTERSSFIADLEGLSLYAAGGARIPMLDALTVSGNESRQHGKLQVVPVRAQAFCDSERGLTILDGAVAATRLGASHARSIVVLLEHAEYDEEVEHVIGPFVSASIDAGIHVPVDGMPLVPKGIEPFVFGLPSSGTNEPA